MGIYDCVWTYDFTNFDPYNHLSNEKEAKTETETTTNVENLSNQEQKHALSVSRIGLIKHHSKL